MSKIESTLRKYILLPLAGSLCLCFATSAHDPITTKITFDREIVRIIDARCTSCHQKGGKGKAFSLATYDDARPWAQDILEETLARQMPPWGAVKGFGDFSNDQALTEDELDLIANWVDGGAPEGDPKDLPSAQKVAAPAPPAHAEGEIIASGDFKIPRPFTLEGLWPRTVPDNASLQITAEFPDGSVEPLIWLQAYKKEFDHPFLLRTPLALPAGTVIHGLASGASITLMPAASAAAASDPPAAPAPAHPNAQY